eukprot:scaffold120220_cov84-Phaeocystis_antarctica.AAC.1
MEDAREQRVHLCEGRPAVLSHRCSLWRRAQRTKLGPRGRGELQRMIAAVLGAALAGTAAAALSAVPSAGVATARSSLRKSGSSSLRAAHLASSRSLSAPSVA